MGFKKRGDERAFLKKVNQLISLHEIDENYRKASKSGREKQGMLGLSEGIDTGSRKKKLLRYYYFYSRC